MRPASVRFRASRPEFRRAGFLFGSASWTVLAMADIGREVMARLVTEPVLTGEYQDEGSEAWKPFSAEDREAAADWLQSQAAGAQEIADLGGDASAEEIVADLRRQLAERDQVHEKDMAELKAEYDELVADLTAQLEAAGGPQPDSPPRRGGATGDDGGAEAPPSDPAAPPAAEPAADPGDEAKVKGASKAAAKEKPPMKP